MKYISCHIENFGRLRNYDYTFTDGLNIVCQENGWGKSTFAAFLCAMLYGLPSMRKKNAAENERDRYRPWQGGVFGGRLVFEAGGRFYEAGRTFGRRESEDTFELRDVETNLPSFDFSAKLGEELFQLHRESFLRTVFTAQLDCRTQATDDINALAANLAEQAGDMGGYEGAMKRLAEAENRLTPKRQTGLLYRHTQEILRLERETAGGHDLQEKLRQCTRELEEEGRKEEDLEKQLHRLETELESAQETWEEKQREAAAEAAGQMRQRLLNTQEKRRRQAREAAAVFPGRIPERAEIEEYLGQCRRLERLEDSIQEAVLSEEEQQRLTELEQVFQDPAQAAGEEIDPAGWALAEPWQIFRDPTEEDGEDTFPERKPSFAGREGQAARDMPGVESFRGNRTAAAACMAGGAILLLAGIAMILLAGTAAGILAAGLGGAAVIAGTAAMAAVPRREGYPGKPGRYSGYSEERRVPLSGAERGAGFAGGRPESLQEEYAYLREKEQRLEELHARWAESRRPILQYLRELGFSPQGNLRSRLEELREAADAYGDARDLLREAEEELRSFDAEMEEKGILLRDGPAERTFLQDGPAEQTLHAQSPAHPQVQKAPQGDADPEALRRQIEEVHSGLLLCRERISDGKRTAGDLQAELEEWENALERLRELRALKEEEHRKYMQVTTAAALLKKAKENLTARCADPIRDRFCCYWEMITRRSAAGVYVDANSNVTVQEMGRQRDAALLSAGFRDLSGICLRAALADAMYPQTTAERPPLILDDPFANLDDEKIEGAMQFLREISTRYQILYFTCSSARCGKPAAFGRGSVM